MERVAQLPAECGDPEMFDMLANFHSVLGKKKKNHPLNIFPLNLRISLINTHTQKKRPQIDQQVKENCRKKKKPKTKTKTKNPNNKEPSITEQSPPQARRPWKVITQATD